MPDPAETNRPFKTGTQSTDKKAGRPSEAILEDILDTMRESDVFPQPEENARFWSEYVRRTKEDDDDFLERHNNDMDMILIFAGLFSSINSAFITNMESGLSPNPSDTTNALLKILINKVNNGTFSDHDASLPVWNGPSSTIIWIQTLAYTSLFTSLLAAFGAVLGKQWLTHYKTSRFGRAVMQERYKIRQRKLDAMERWHFNTIMATLPTFLQLSLLFFGIALAANIWIRQHTIASMVMATTGFGVIFYSFTLIASLKSPDCPFQTPLSTVIKHRIESAVSFRRTVLKKGKDRPKSWAGVLVRVLDAMKVTSRTVQDVVTGYVPRAIAYISRLLSALMRRYLANPPPATWQAGTPTISLQEWGVQEWSAQEGSAQESSGHLQEGSAQEWSAQESSGNLQFSPPSPQVTAPPPPPQRTAPSLPPQWSAPLPPPQRSVPSLLPRWQPIELLEPLDLSCLDSSVDSAHPRAIQYTIETSTDTEVITAAMMMVTEVEWPETCNIVDRLKEHFDACFDPTGQRGLLTQRRATACLQAMCHVDPVTRGSIRLRHRGIVLNDRTYDLPRDQRFLLVSCALDGPNELEITSLRPSDRMWLAFMFTYRLYDQENSSRFNLLNFLPEFIDKCLHDRLSLPPRLVADCLLLSGLMMGLRPDRRYLARLDKSVAIPELVNWVIGRMLDLLLGEPSLSQRDFPGNARKLLQPLARLHESRSRSTHDVSMRWIKLCFLSLEDERPGAGGADVRFKDIAATIRHTLLSSPYEAYHWTWLFMHEVGRNDDEMHWIGPPEGYTPAQFDLLVDYLLRVCDGANYEAIGDTLVILAGLGGSPTSEGRKRLYIETTVRCMAHDQSIYVRHAAMSAASAIRTEVVSLGRDDGSFRELFSRNLTLAVSAPDVTSHQQIGTPLDDKPFYEDSLYVTRRDMCYLNLLSALARVPIWHEDLNRHALDHLTESHWSQEVDHQ